MNRTQDYINLINKHVKELEDFPVVYVFDNSQIDAALAKLGANDISECTTVHDKGDIMLKKDVPRYKLMAMRQYNELMEAMQNTEFAYAAFRYEMDEHEYYINPTGDDDILECFGLQLLDLYELNLLGAYLKARMDHINEMKGEKI